MTLISVIRRGHPIDQQAPEQAIQALDIALRQAKFHERICRPVGGGFYYPEAPDTASSLGRGVQVHLKLQIWHSEKPLKFQEQEAQALCLMHCGAAGLEKAG